LLIKKLASAISSVLCHVEPDKVGRNIYITKIKMLHFVQHDS
jgi:hypothetical protein